MNKFKRLAGVLAIALMIGALVAVVTVENVSAFSSEDMSVQELIELSKAITPESAPIILALLDSSPALGLAEGSHYTLLTAEQFESTGAATFGGTVSITGAVTFSAALSVGTTLTVTGATTVEELTTGGTALSTTTLLSAYTITQAELLTNAMWEIFPSSTAITLTLPATSTLTTLIPNSTDRRGWRFVNTTSSDAIALTFAAGTGIDLQVGASTTLTVAPGGNATLDCYRQVDTDVTCLFTPYVVGD